MSAPVEKLMFTVHEAKTHLTQILTRVENGQPVIITRAGKPIAEIVPAAPQTVTFGLLKGELEFDPQTFDDVDEDTILMFEGR